MGQSNAQVVAVAIIFPTCALFTTVIRPFVRRYKQQQLLWDDWLLFIATALLIGFTTVPTTILAIHYNLGNHQKFVNGNPVPSTFHEELTHLLMEIVASLSFELSKLSVLFLYRRIFLGRVVIITWILIALVTIFAIGNAIAVTVKCTPIRLALKDRHSPQLHCVDELALYNAGAGIDIVMDVIILVTPWPSIWRLNLPLMRKIGVICIFGLGALATGANIARLVVFLKATNMIKNGNKDRSYIVAPTVYWTVISSSLVIIAATLPILRPIFHHHSIQSAVYIGRTVLTLGSRSPKRGEGNACPSEPQSQDCVAENGSAKFLSGYPYEVSA